MQGMLEALSSTLYAQVRDAGPTHGYDSEGYLRPKAHPANISTVYLGDIAQTLLKVVQGVSTPIMEEKPGFDVFRLPASPLPSVPAPLHGEHYRARRGRWLGWHLHM